MRAARRSPRSVALDEVRPKAGLPARNGGSARVLLRPSITQRYKMDGKARRRHAEASDIVFDYSNVSEGNEIWGANQGATGGRRRAT